jgi:acetolactate synthase-1/2/3 large subunit
MGYDLPAAIGVALARPGKPSYCLAGDGSLMMNLQELQTLVGYRLPVKVLVINNHGYVSIKQTQKAYFADNVFGTGPEDGVSMPDFVRMATGFCIPAIKVDSIEGLRSQAVKDLLALEGPALIDVHVDPEQNFSPKLASRKLDDGTMVSPALEDMAPFLSRDEFAENIIGP